MEKKKLLRVCLFCDRLSLGVNRMIEIFKNPEIIGAFSAISAEKFVSRNRSSHALLFKINGESVYSFPSEDICVGAGAVLFIPQGTSYTVKKTMTGESSYCLINFYMESEGELRPKRFQTAAGDGMLQIFRQVEHSQRFGGAAYRAESLAAFYHLLAQLIRIEQLPYTTDRQKQRIDPAIRYLEKHLFDKNLRIEQLPQLCDLSAPSFRKLFASRFGTTPKKYLQHQRLQAAKLMLESGEYDDISSVAQAVGFDDPLHFSRCFKSLYGMPPSEIK